MVFIFFVSDDVVCLSSQRVKSQTTRRTFPDWAFKQKWGASSRGDIFNRSYRENISFQNDLSDWMQPLLLFLKQLEKAYEFIQQGKLREDQKSAIHIFDNMTSVCLLGHIGKPIQFISHFQHIWNLLAQSGDLGNFEETKTVFIWTSNRNQYYQRNVRKSPENPDFADSRMRKSP